jgi:ribulose-5-phosphate 4-epimerase/fuculose-1-phosphate aldolase
MAMSDAEPSLIADLVAANHILCDQGVVDGFGHVSARHDKHPDRFLLARNLAPALVTVEDILAFDLEGNTLGGDTRPVYLERFIHSEIYRARPDVMAVVHSHSPAIIPFGVVKDVPLRPIFHMAGFLGASTPIFEIRTVDPESDLLIRDARLGAALAGSLGANPVVLMRGHGATAVGGNVRQAVYRAIYAEINARLQAAARQLGPVTFLNDAEAKNFTAGIDSQIDRAWNFWKMRVAG